jgi:hypothetical protein
MANISISVTGIDRDIQMVKGSLSKRVQEMATTLLKEVKKETPVATGRARRGWTKQVDDKGFTVENTVPYVEYLEKPYVHSKKAPQGMIGPALNTLKGKYK